MKPKQVKEHDITLAVLRVNKALLEWQESEYSEDHNNFINLMGMIDSLKITVKNFNKQQFVS